MKKLIPYIIFSVLLTILVEGAIGGTSGGDVDHEEQTGTTSTGIGPSSSSDTSFTNSEQIKIVGNTKISKPEGFSQDGNKFHVDSAQSIYTGGFVFNDVSNVDIVAEDNKLVFASLISAKDDNRIVITNPLDPNEVEKINIYLNNSQTFSYSFDDENVTITIPAASKAVIAKGSKNITVEPNGAQATIKIDNSKITGPKGEIYDKPKYTISGANLTYQNRDIMERLVTAGEASVRIDTEKGFGYLLLNGQTNILPGDSYEYYDLRKKEKSYALYNPGTTQYEYGFLKAGFI